MNQHLVITMLVLIPLVPLAVGCSSKCESYRLVGDTSWEASACPGGASYEVECARDGESANTRGWTGPYTCACSRNGTPERNLSTSPFPWREGGHDVGAVHAAVNAACGWEVPAP